MRQITCIIMLIGCLVQTGCTRPESIPDGVAPTAVYDQPPDYLGGGIYYIPTGNGKFGETLELFARTHKIISLTSYTANCTTQGYYIIAERREEE